MKKLIFTICCAVSPFLFSEDLFISQNDYTNSDYYKNVISKQTVDSTLYASYEDQTSVLVDKDSGAPLFQYALQDNEVVFLISDKDVFAESCQCVKVVSDNLNDVFCVGRQKSTIIARKINNYATILNVKHCSNTGTVIFNAAHEVDKQYLIDEFKKEKVVFINFSEHVSTYFKASNFNKLMEK